MSYRRIDERYENRPPFVGFGRGVGSLPGIRPYRSRQIVPPRHAEAKTVATVRRFSWEETTEPPASSVGTERSEVNPDAILSEGEA